MGSKPMPHHIGMIVQKFCADNQIGNDKLTLWPEVALIEKHMRIAFVDQAGSPGLRGPGSIQLLLKEKCQLIGVCQRYDLYVPTLIDRLHPVRLQPGAQSDILSVAKLR